jgi:hypothetical protein
MDPNQIHLSENEVVFEGDRLEPEYADVPDNGEQSGLQMAAQIIYKSFDY